MYVQYITAIISSRIVGEFTTYYTEKKEIVNLVIIFSIKMIIATIELKFKKTLY